MSDSRPAYEKTTSKYDEKWFFWKNSKFKTYRKDVDHDEKKNPFLESAMTTEPVEPELDPVSFAGMFRFSTRQELSMDLIGLVAAAGAGAAQPLMTLLFGKLTRAFVNFEVEVAKKYSDPTNSTVMNQFNIDAALFRSQAATDALFVTVIGIGMFVCTYIYMYLWTYTGEANAKRIRENYLQAVLRQDIQFFDTVGAGEIATRIQTDTNLVQRGMSEKVALVVNFLSTFATAFILAYVRNWRLALAMSSILPCIGIVVALMNKFISKYMRLSLEYVADGGSLAEEVISTVRTAQAFGIQSILADLYHKNIYKAEIADGKAAIWNGGGLAVLFFIIYASYGLAFDFGTTLILESHANSGEVINVFFSILIGSFSLTMLAPEMQAINHGRGAAAKLYATIDRIPAIDSADPSGTKPEHVEGEITLENIKFNYPSRPGVTVVKGLSLSFCAGRTSALVGASGSGKSTVISLVERFYDPLSGSIKLDGQDIKTLNLKWWRSQIGLVSQEPTLFATTIKGNVAHGLIGTKHENVGDDEKFALIKEACIKSNADGFISRLPLGYDTIVGERGFLLSGGQKQRIAIARAIVSDPRVLLLDEATSALDTQSESVVQDALDKAAAGRTTIIISHRLSTIKDADMIFVMGEGVIIEQGTHDELLINDGPYAQLVQSQKLREADENTELAENVESFGGTPQDIEGAVLGEIYLGRKDIGWSLASKIPEQRHQESLDGHTDHKTTYPYLFRRMGKINRVSWKNYLFGGICAIMTGLVFPACGIVAAKGINNFTYQGHAERAAGDRTALWFFLITVASSFSIGVQNYNFSVSAAALSARLRSLSFRAILRQDRRQTTQRVVILKDQANKEEHSTSAQLACEAAASIRTVASLTREEDCCSLYSKSLEEPLRKSNRTVIFSSGLYAISQSMIFFVISFVFWYGSRLVSSREFSTFQFFVGLMCSTFSSMQAGDVFSFVPDMSSAKGAATDIIKLIDSIPRIDAESSEGKHMDPTQVRGQIRIENIHFGYPTRPGIRVIRDLSIQIEPGTHVALVGKSGCGKSTVIQMIQRFYDPLAGHIYLDGDDISDLNVTDYRKSIALVSQEPTLYAGTVCFNILLGAIKPASEVTQEEIVEACRKANILEFIESLPEGFNTEVGGKGSQLSGGQKQRIAIARALLRDPKILLLDEATSALDSNSEKSVQAALDAASKGRTTIAIAHRLSTIQNADRIYFIKEGAVSEAGTHEQLLNQKGDYHEFVQLQALGK